MSALSVSASSRAAQAIAALNGLATVDVPSAWSALAKTTRALAEVLTLHSPCDCSTHAPQLAQCTVCWTAWPCPTARTVLNTVET